MKESICIVICGKLCGSMAHLQLRELSARPMLLANSKSSNFKLMTEIGKVFRDQRRAS
jgi:hypothetical protein